MASSTERENERVTSTAQIDLLWIGLLFCLILWVFGSSYAWQSYLKTGEQAEEALKETSQRLAQYVSLSFGQIDTALLETSYGVRQQPEALLKNPVKKINEIRSFFLGLHQISDIQFFDVQSQTVLARNQNETDDLSQIERDQILQNLSQNTPVSFFLNGAQTGDLKIAYPVGEIGAPPMGALIATLKPTYMDDILKAGTQKKLLGYILASELDILHSYPKNFDLPAHRLRAQEKLTIDKAIINHKRSLIVTAPVPNFELYIHVLEDFDTIYKDWTDQTSAYAIIALIFSSLILYGARRMQANMGRLRREVDSRRKAQESLKIVSQAVAQSPTAVIITDRTSRITYVNAKFSETTGYSAQEVLGENPKILSAHVDTTTDYQDMWTRLLNGQDWHGEFHNKRKDGSLYWERALITSIKNDEGEISHFLAIKEDITENKEAADQLKLAGVVFDTASEAIMVCDRMNRIIMVNSSFSEITGYQASEVIGQTPALFNSGHHKTRFFKDMFDALKEDGKWQGEIWNKRKNGDIYPQWLSIKTIPDKDGKIERYISLFTDITKRKKDEERILYQANYDTLTGLPNRSLFKDRLERALIRADRTKSKIALMFLDLDRFKNVNDTLGHAAGDALLIEAAKRLTNTVRKTDTVARLGGDEFTIILNDLVDEIQTNDLIEKLLETLSAPYDIGTDQAFVSASIGITVFPDDGHTLDELLKNADAAMYRAKENGRNMSQFFTQEMNEKANQRRALESSLYQALDREEFAIHYQPIIDPKTGHLYSCEALLRWVHPEHGFVSPATFIPLAEETGQIIPIGNWVVQHVFNEAKLWEKYIPNPPKVAVNLSSIQFMRANAYRLLSEALQESGLSAQRVTVEITESLLVEDDHLILEQLNKIREMGIGLSIDDFGTGYSSLSYLKKFPITTLKIDRSFISDMTQQKDSENIVDAILSMAQSLDLNVVAEGVETSGQKQALVEKKCSFIQGYYYSPPLPVAAFRDLIKKDQPLEPDTAA